MGIMNPVKYIWALRALLYKPFFKHMGFMSYIGEPCIIDNCKHISVGNKTRIFPGIRLEAIDDGEIIIGNNCAIQQNVHITSANESLIIGDGVTILANSYVTNIEHNYEDIFTPILEQGYKVSTTLIGDGCFICTGSAIQAGTILGKHCVVVAHSFVKGIFPDYSVIVGCPARIIKHYDTKTKKWIKD